MYVSLYYSSKIPHHRGLAVIGFYKQNIVTGEREEGARLTAD